MKREDGIRLLDEIIQLKNVIEQLHKTIKLVEWIWVEGDCWNPVDVCPWCQQRETKGHAPNCERQLSIALAEKYK